MKKLLSILAGVMLLGSCATDQLNENEKTELLTSVSWKTGEGSGYSIDKFNPDGTYSKKFENIPMELRGTWTWIGENEISLTETEIWMNGVGNRKPVKQSDKTILKIVSLSVTELTGLSRHILDAEDSGFAKNVVYTAVR